MNSRSNAGKVQQKYIQIGHLMSLEFWQLTEETSKLDNFINPINNVGDCLLECKPKCLALNHLFSSS